MVLSSFHKSVPVVKCNYSLIALFLSRPHISISKLAVSESYETYISRSFQVTREILSECNNSGGL